MKTPFTEDAIHAFLGVISELFPVDAIEERLDDDPCLVNVTDALKALGTDGDGLFESKHRASQRFATLVQTLKTNSVTVKGRSSTDRFVDFDLCMNLVMKEWYTVVVNQHGEISDKSVAGAGDEEADLDSLGGGQKDAAGAE